MPRINPEVHTPIALQTQIETLHHANPEAYLIGSIGRAILFNAYQGSAEYEFAMRQQNPVGTTERARDIDLIVCKEPYVIRPFEVDTSTTSRKYGEIVFDAGVWYLVAERYRFSEALHEDVMTPVLGESVYGAKGKTIPIQTSIALFGLQAELRHKDVFTRELLVRTEATIPEKHKLPLSLYKMFDVLREQNRQNAYLKVRDVYRKHIPLSVRSRAVRFTSLVRATQK